MFRNIYFFPGFTKYATVLIFISLWKDKRVQMMGRVLNPA